MQTDFVTLYSFEQPGQSMHNRHVLPTENQLAAVDQVTKAAVSGGS
jgi:hypothetical protein